MDGTSSGYQEEERRIQDFMRKPAGKCPFGRPRFRWWNNIRWIFRSRMWGMDWIELA
jgi:hypothetical protein